MDGYPQRYTIFEFDYFISLVRSLECFLFSFLSMGVLLASATSWLVCLFRTNPIAPNKFERYCYRAELCQLVCIRRLRLLLLSRNSRRVHELWQGKAYEILTTRYLPIYIYLLDIKDRFTMRNFQSDEIAISKCQSLSAKAL